MPLGRCAGSGGTVGFCSLKLGISVNLLAPGEAGERRLDGSHLREILKNSFSFHV